MKTRLDASTHLLAEALELVRRRAGLVFTDTRRPAFESVLLACMRRSGAVGLSEYLELLAERPELFDELTAAVTVGETYFLRDPAQWDLLRTRLLPPLLARLGGRSLRTWSAGCATGEEPYSAAIVLHQLGALGQASIIGTDISRPALAKAGRAEYHAWSLRDVPEDLERQYFRPRGGRFELAPWLRTRVEFRYLNLAEETPPGPHRVPRDMDLILCRNVLIYFDQDTVARVARRLIDSLGQEGCLLLGASDPLIGDLAPCEVEVTSVGLVYRRVGTRARTTVRALPPAAPPPWPPQAPAGLAASQAVISTTGLAPVGSGTADALENDRLAEVRRRYGAKDYAGAAALADAFPDGERSAELEILAVRARANQGDLAGAGRACAAALDVHRTCAELLYLHAVLLTQAARYAEASDALRRALYLDRDMAVAHLALGEARLRLGDTEAAKRAFRVVERLLTGVPPEAPITGSDGEPAVRFVEAARARLLLLEPRRPDATN